MEQLSVNSNKRPIPKCSATKYISYESSTFHLSGDIIHIPLRLSNNIRAHNNCHRTGTFSGSIAGMTSQIWP